MIILGIYVDDIFFISQDPRSTTKLVDYLKIYNIKSLGPVKKCLGISVTKQGNGWVLHQKDYIREVLERFRMAECKEQATPVDNNQKHDLG